MIRTYLIFHDIRTATIKSFFSVIEYKQGLVPIRPKDGCPMDTFDGRSTCFCEDRCSWEVCRLDPPPITCPMVDWWSWNSKKMHYVAQRYGK